MVKISLSFAFPGRPRQLPAFWAINGARAISSISDDDAARARWVPRMSHHRERRCEGAARRLFLPRLSMVLPRFRSAAVETASCHWLAVRGRGQAVAVGGGYAKQGAVAPNDWSVRGRGGARPLRGGAWRRLRNPSRGRTCPGVPGKERGNRDRSGVTGTGAGAVGPRGCENRAPQARAPPLGL